MREVLNGRYGVDCEGVLYSLRNKAGNRRQVPLVMRTKQTKEGYFSCTVYVGTSEEVSKHTYYVHRLVAQAYVSNPECKPEVNHLDGNKGNNLASNLEWVTKSENSLHAFTLGLRSPNRTMLGRFNEHHNRSRAIRQLTLDGEFIKWFPSLMEAARQGFSQGNIGSVIAGRRKSHAGFKWVFA